MVDISQPNTKQPSRLEQVNPAYWVLGVILGAYVAYGALMIAIHPAFLYSFSSEPFPQEQPIPYPMKEYVAKVIVCGDPLLME